MLLHVLVGTVALKVNSVHKDSYDQVLEAHQHPLIMDLNRFFNKKRFE
jgi:hypothetical protein